MTKPLEFADRCDVLKVKRRKRRAPLPTTSRCSPHRGRRNAQLPFCAKPLFFSSLSPNNSAENHENLHQAPRWTNLSNSRFYIDRTSGGYCHYCHSSQFALAGFGQSKNQSSRHHVPEQQQTTPDRL